MVDNIELKLSEAVAYYWRTRLAQTKRQKESGRSDHGLRGAVTGGAQMDGFIKLLRDIVCAAGIDSGHIYHDTALELPGFFRPTKKWDLLVVRDGQLLAAFEVKSQGGPSFGNNFNNRIEEAIGTASDLWTAYREGAFKRGLRPWLGYFFLLEDCDGSRKPVKSNEPHFKVFPEFVDASYARRYEIFCQKLIRERHYDAASLVLSGPETGLKGVYLEPTEELGFRRLATLLSEHIRAGKKLSP